MNIQLSRQLSEFALKTGHAHDIIVARMAECKSHEELAIPLYAYQICYPSTPAPNTPMFRDAQNLITRTIENEAHAFAVNFAGASALPPRQHIEHGPRSQLTTNYQPTILPPRRKPNDPNAGKDDPRIKSVRKTNPQVVTRFNRETPKHWRNPGFKSHAR